LLSRDGRVGVGLYHRRAAHQTSANSAAYLASEHGLTGRGEAVLLDVRYREVKRFVITFPVRGHPPASSSSHTTLRTEAVGGKPVSNPTSRLIQRGEKGDVGAVLRQHGWVLARAGLVFNQRRPTDDTGPHSADFGLGVAERSGRPLASTLPERGMDRAGRHHVPETPVPTERRRARNRCSHPLPALGRVPNPGSRAACGCDRCRLATRRRRHRSVLWSPGRDGSRPPNHRKANSRCPAPRTARAASRSSATVRRLCHHSSWSSLHYSLKAPARVSKAR
jgi:hypothetical protein